MAVESIHHAPRKTNWPALVGALLGIGVAGVAYEASQSGGHTPSVSFEPQTAIGTPMRVPISEEVVHYEFGQKIGEIHGSNGLCIYMNDDNRYPMYRRGRVERPAQQGDCPELVQE